MENFELHVVMGQNNSSHSTIKLSQNQHFFSKNIKKLEGLITNQNSHHIIACNINQPVSGGLY